MLLHTYFFFDYFNFISYVCVYFREYAIADYLENNGYNDAFEAFKKDANIVCCFNDSFFKKI